MFLGSLVSHFVQPVDNPTHGVVGGFAHLADCDSQAYFAGKPVANGEPLKSAASTVTTRYPQPMSDNQFYKAMIGLGLSENDPIYPQWAHDHHYDYYISSL